MENLAAVLEALRPYRHTRKRVVLTAVAMATAATLVGQASADASPSRPLSWSAPALNNPTTVHVTTGNRDLRLDDRKDYRLVMSKGAVEGELQISGGRNVVLVGGEIRIPSRRADRGLYLKNQTGTIHIEGVNITGALKEGINLDQRRGATVQLQNINVDTATGNHHGNHADVLQTWGGPKILRIDGLRGRTTYQGMFLTPHQYDSRIGLQQWDFRNVFISGSAKAGYGYWKQPGLNITSKDVYFHRENGDTSRAYWGAWPGVINGAPSYDVVSGKPGLGYVSNGVAKTASPKQPPTPDAVPAQASKAPGSDRQIITNSGQALDVAWASSRDGARILQYRNHRGANQRWRITPTGRAGHFNLVSVQSGKCVDVAPSSGSKAGIVRQWTCNGSISQQWRMNPSGQTTIINRATNLALDVPGNQSTVGLNLQQWKQNGTTAQTFRIQ